MTRAPPPPPEENRALLGDDINEDDASSSDDIEPILDSMGEIIHKPLIIEQENLKASDVPEEEQIVGPDQFVAGYETTQWEIWSYYLCYVGNTGLASFYFAPTAFQNLLSQAAGDAGVLNFAGRQRSVNSIVLLANGISFSIQAVIFVFLGSFADFGSWRPYILIVQTLIGVAIGFGWLGVHSPEKWEYAAALYIVGLITFQTSYAYFLAAFPGLARNTTVLREKAEEYKAGKISLDAYEFFDSMKRNEISNMSSWCSGVGELPILAIGVGILYGIHANASVDNNNWGLSVVIAWASAAWLACSIPWFVLEKKRPGQDVPPGMNIVVAGLWQLGRALTQIWKLKQTLMYFIGFFLLGDAFNTTVIVVQTLQAQVLEFNTIQLALVNMVALTGQSFGIYTYWKIQQRWGINTKSMLSAVAIGIVALDVWGMIGIWTQKIGYHHRWEFWLYQGCYGFFVCPWYSYSQTMISEVTPRGKEFLFFSLFNVMGKASSFIGPIISSAIIDASPTKNASTPFYFLAALSTASFLVIAFFVDIKTSRKEQEEFLTDERAAKQGMAQSMGLHDIRD